MKKEAVKKPKYKKGKFPNTIFNTENKTLYVRRSISVNKFVKDEKTGKEKFVKQAQIWKVCDPPTKERAKEILDEINEDIKIAKSGKTRPLINFDEVAAKFLELEFQPAVFRNGKKVSGKIQTAGPTGYVKTLVKFFAAQDISTITYSQIQEFKKERLNTSVEKWINVKETIPEAERVEGSRKKIRIKKVLRKSPRSIRSVNYELTILKQIFNFAIRSNWLEKNPFALGNNLIDTNAESKRHEIWSDDEQGRALAACTGKTFYFRVIILLIVDGGLRKGELLNALWKDVDFDNSVMLAKNYKGNELRVRPVFLTKRAKAALLEWKELQKKDPRIAKKTHVIGFTEIKKAWTGIRNKIGRPDLRIHDLRHVFGTRLNNKKIPLKNISEMLGHKQITTTQIYLNPSYDHLRESAEALETDE